MKRPSAKQLSTLFLISILLLVVVTITLFPSTPTVGASGDQGSFGFTTIGTTYSNYVADTIIGSAFTCTQTGHADSMSVALYVASGTLSVNMSCGYYLHSDLSLVGNTTASSVTLTTTKTWFAFTFPTPKPDVVGGSEYVLVFFVDYVATSFRCARENNVTTDQGHYESRDYALGYSNPLSATHLTREYSIYCNYTISPPYGIKYGVTPPYPMGGDTVMFPIHWYTDTGTLSHCNIEMNDTGTVHNSTFTAFPASQTDYLMYLNVTIETGGNCYITWRSFCNSSLDIYGVTSTATFWVSTKSQELWVQDLTGVEEDFPVTGSAPYLNNDTTNYLKIPDIGDNESWFTFHFYAGTVEQTWLNIEGCSLLLNITLYNGVANYTYQADFPETLAWQTINVTDAVDTATKVNATQMRLTAAEDGGISSRVSRCYLRVYKVYSSNFGLTSQITGKSTTLYCLFTSKIGLSTYAINHNASGSWLEANISGALTGTEDWANATVTITTTSLSSIAFIFYVNDTSNDWDSTNIIDEPILWSRYSDSDFNYISDNTGAASFQHSLGRNNYYVNFTEGETFWVHFCNGTHFVYYASYDGKNYSSNGVIRAAESGSQGGYFYGVLEERGGTNYYHYEYCNEKNGSSIYYRKGIFNYNLTITWMADEQVAIPNTNASYSMCVNGIAVSPSGYVWIGYWGLSATWFNVTLCTETNGTWVTYAGYPKATDYEPPMDETNIALEGYVYGMPEDYDCYVVTCYEDRQVLGWLIDNNVVGSSENVSDLYAYEARHFNGFSAYGDIHVAYLTNNTEIRYCWRNYTSGAWEIKDELVSSYGDWLSYPVIAIDRFDNTTSCNWATEDYWSLWLSFRNATAWQTRQRLVVAPSNMYISHDPNIIPEWGYKTMLFAMDFMNDTTGHSEVWTYFYPLSFTTDLTVGWNDFAPLDRDVGHALAEVNASLTLDGIDWSVIVIDYNNGTQWSLVYGTSYNSEKLVTSIDNTFDIYCNVAGTWTHTYP